MDRSSQKENDERLTDAEEGGKSADLLSHLSYEALLQKLEESQQQLGVERDRLLRLQAENENAERRREREISKAHKYALEKFATALLPIIDSLELSIHNAKERKDPAEMESYIEGIHLTLKLFYGVMEKFGIKQLNPTGEVFDPEFHQAISMQQDASFAAGTVISVLQRGYTLNGRLLRPALVVVAQ